MNVTARGPIGARLGLANVEAELYGVRVTRVGSG